MVVVGESGGASGGGRRRIGRRWWWWWWSSESRDSLVVVVVGEGAGGGGEKERSMTAARERVGKLGPTTADSDRCPCSDYRLVRCPPACGASGLIRLLQRFVDKARPAGTWCSPQRYKSRTENRVGGITHPLRTSLIDIGVFIMDTEKSRLHSTEISRPRSNVDCNIEGVVFVADSGNILPASLFTKL
ncbi:hypothetical protein ABFS83_11G134000 [Erythranthe nasuta]